jgi:hypothetical protein
LCGFSYSGLFSNLTKFNKLKENPSFEIELMNLLPKLLNQLKRNKFNEQNKHSHNNFCPPKFKYIQLNLIFFFILKLTLKSIHITSLYPKKCPLTFDYALKKFPKLIH